MASNRDALLLDSDAPVVRVASAGKPAVKRARDKALARAAAQLSATALIPSWDDEWIGVPLDALLLRGPWPVRFQVAAPSMKANGVTTVTRPKTSKASQVYAAVPVQPNPGWTYETHPPDVRTGTPAFGKCEVNVVRGLKVWRTGVGAATARLAQSGRRVVDPPLARALLDAQTDAAVDAAFDEVFDLFAETKSRQGREAFDQLLEWVARPGIAMQLHVGVLLACLRLSSPIRSALSHWNAARDAAARALQERDEDVDALLCGLLR